MFKKLVVYRGGVLRGQLSQEYKATTGVVLSAGTHVSLSAGDGKHYTVTDYRAGRPAFYDGQRFEKSDLPELE